MTAHDHLITWNGMAISIRHVVNWTNTGFDHLEITTIEPERAALPITETGYRSHFVTPAELERYGCVAAFVIAWLEAESESDAWKAACERSRQLSLF
jgi:hypothetical protein